MTTYAAPGRLTLHLRLGRVSNLPTVWTNVLAGAVLGGGALRASAIVPAAVAMSSFYVGGMYLNDAFDADTDAVERPERPIPAGHVSAREVFVMGFGLLAIGMVILLGAFAFGLARPSSLVTGALLGGAIVVYDAWHKQNPASPFVMGVCRVLVYLTAALATGGSIGTDAWAGAAILLSYLIGLTYIAKQENLSELRGWWPLAFLGAPLVYAPVRGLATTPVMIAMAAIAFWVGRAIATLRARKPGAIPKTVGALIAGISLVDAMLAAAHGHGFIAIAAALGLPVTLVLHRRVAGT